MHELEPYYNWRDWYDPEEDSCSPFYGHEPILNRIYNYVLHPAWDAFGSSTLYAKLIFADYDEGFAVLELIGEWNDCLHNDVMYLKRHVIEPLMDAGIDRFVLIGENVLNFHASDDCYYEEWYEEVAERQGWIAAVNFREHVLEEMLDAGLDNFMAMSGSPEAEPNPALERGMTAGQFPALQWRAVAPLKLCRALDAVITRRLGAAVENPSQDRRAG